MANVRQDRGPDPTLTRTYAQSSEGSGLNGHATSPRGIVLSLRLRIPDSSSGGAGVSLAADSPAATLAVDILTASGGAPDAPGGAVLSARFVNLQSALLAARRLQWALEGLAESGAAAGAGMLIRPAEDGLSATAATALEAVVPGRVLLTRTLAEAVPQLTGLSLLPGGGDWREFEWRSPGEPSNLSADEQAVLGLIRGLGREDPLATRVVTTAPVTGPAAVPGTGSYQAPAGLGRSTVEESEPGAVPIWKKPWTVVSAGAVVLVIIAVLVIRAMTPGSAPQGAAPDSTRTAVPAPSATTTVPGAEAKQTAVKPATKSGKRVQPEPQGTPKVEAKTEPPAPKPPAGSCDLTETEIPLSLQRAGRLMSAGNLAGAQDAYQRLVGCPSAREKALEGLRAVKQRMAAQGTN